MRLNNFLQTQYKPPGWEPKQWGSVGEMAAHLKRLRSGPALSGGLPFGPASESPMGQVDQYGRQVDEPYEAVPMIMGSHGGFGVSGAVGIE